LDSYKVIVNYVQVPCGMLPKMYENGEKVPCRAGNFGTSQDGAADWAVRG